jgi:hypothetical protein
MRTIAAAVLLVGATPGAHAYIDDVELQLEARHVRTTLDASCTARRARAGDCTCRATFRIVAIHAAPVKWPIDPGHELALEYRCDRQGAPAAQGGLQAWARAQGNGTYFVHVPLSDIVQAGPRRWELDNANGRYAPPASAGTPRVRKEAP